MPNTITNATVDTKLMVIPTMGIVAITPRMTTGTPTQTHSAAEGARKRKTMQATRMRPITPLLAITFSRFDIS